MPRVSSDDIDVQMYGTYGAPAYVAQPGDRSVRASARLVRATMSLLRQAPLSGLDEARQASDAFNASLPDRATATDEQLLASIDTFFAP